MIAHVVLKVLRIVWHNRELRRVSFAYLAFNVAEWATWLAMLVYAYDHGGVTASGIVATALLLPAAVLAPVLASAGERLPPGTALFAGYATQAASSALVAVVMLANARPAVVYAALVVPSVAYTMTRPTQSALTPGLARRPEDLAASNVVVGWIESIGTLLAPLVVGVVLTFSSPGAAFAVGAAVCAVGAVLVWPLRRVVAASAPAEEDDATTLRGALAAVREDPNARMLVLLLGAQATALGALDILYVELARGVLHRGGNWAGYLNAATGVGSVLAVVITARLVGQKRLALPLVISLGGWTVALFALASSPGIVGDLSLLAVAGGAQATFSVTARTLLQRVARSDLLARVFGMLEGLEMLGLAAGSLLTPVLVGLGGATAAFVGVGLLLPVVALTAGGRLLSIDRHATAPVVEAALLRSLPMFALLPPAQLETLAAALEPIAVEGGVDVITEGDEGDRFYVIADGEVDVLAGETQIATLGRGDGFGEIALLYDVPRTATVRTRGACDLYALDRETFLVALTGRYPAEAALRGLADERLAELLALREATAVTAPESAAP